MNLFSPSEKTLQNQQNFLGEHRLASALGWERLVSRPFQMFGAVFLIALTVSLLIIFSISYQKSSHIMSKLSSQLIIIPVDGISENKLESLKIEICQDGLLMHCDITGLKDIMEDFSVENEIGNSILPTILIAEYSPSLSLKSLGDLQNRLNNHPDIASFDLDLLWSAQLSQWIFLVNTGIFFLGAILTLSVALVIHYVTTLFMDKYQKEIEILYHLGASEKFIKRPYLYQGFFLGTMGAMGAIVILSGLMSVVGSTISSLLDLYGVTWVISAQEQIQATVITISVIFFALISAAISTQKWLTAFERERNQCY